MLVLADFHWELLSFELMFCSWAASAAMSDWVDPELHLRPWSMVIKVPCIFFETAVGDGMLELLKDWSWPNSCFTTKVFYGWR